MAMAKKHDPDEVSMSGEAARSSYQVRKSNREERSGSGVVGVNSLQIDLSEDIDYIVSSYRC